MCAAFCRGLKVPAAKAFTIFRIMRTSLKLIVCSFAAAPLIVAGTENLPQLPVPQVVSLPKPGQFIVTPWYTYNYWKAYWKNAENVHINVEPQDGFDQNNGMVSLQYGLCDRWALDLTVGYASAAARFFDPDNQPHTTLGLMDTQIGVRYQVLKEKRGSWTPNLTLRAGGIIEGTYDDSFPFAPGDGASGFEPSVAFTKQLFDFGLGLYGRGGWRVRTENVPQTLFASFGAVQNIRFDGTVQNIQMHFGYLHLQDLKGRDIKGTHRRGLDISYAQDVKEVIRGIEGGINCTFSNGWLLQYLMEYSMEGRNTPQKTHYGLYLSIPFGGS